MSEKQETTPPTPSVVIQCPHCGHDDHICLIWIEHQYARVYSEEISGNTVPLGSVDSYGSDETKLVCSHCSGEWNVPNNADFQW